MPRATIWIKDKNFKTWQAIQNKSDFINSILEEEPAKKQDEEPIYDTVE